MSAKMKRRDFITLLGSAAAWPLAARAQQPVSKMPRIGIIDPTAQWDPFLQGLRDLGYIEGRNIAGSRFVAKKSMICPMWSCWTGSAVIKSPSGRSRMMAAKTL